MAYYDAPKAVRDRIAKFSLRLSITTFFVILGVCIYLGVSLWGAAAERSTHEITAKAHKQWRVVPGHVVRNVTSYGNSTWSHTKSIISYRDWQGQPQTKKVSLGGTPEKGQEVNVEIDAKGRSFVPANRNTWEDENPLEPYTPDPGEDIAVSAIAGLILGFIGAAFVKYWSEEFQIAAWRRRRGKVRLTQIVGMKLRRGILKIRDNVKLRWEFHRRQKRLKATHAYRAVRRFQAELARMDPPKGINPPESLVTAKRKANQLLTEVLQRDTIRAEDIGERIDSIREEVSRDIQARQLAMEEIRQNEGLIG